jgi:hypothetical protein
LSSLIVIGVFKFVLQLPGETDFLPLRIGGFQADASFPEHNFYATVFIYLLTHYPFMSSDRTILMSISYLFVTYPASIITQSHRIR